eukprot:7485114-Pyramimonas_sp.AAC.1
MPYVSEGASALAALNSVSRTKSCINEPDPSSGWRYPGCPTATGVMPPSLAFASTKRKLAPNLRTRCCKSLHHLSLCSDACSIPLRRAYDTANAQVHCGAEHIAKKVARGV